MLPELPNHRGAQRLTLNAFGGLDRRAGAGNGAICDMENLTGAHAPVLAARPPRHTLRAVTKPNGLFSDGEHLFHVDGSALCADGARVVTVTDTKKVFAALGRRVLVWPDKLLIRPGTEDDAGQGGDVPAWVAEALEVRAETSCTFADGTYAGEAAEGNTILAASSAFDWGGYFRVGDAVTVSGAADAENNKTAIVREIAGNALRFYENCFTVNATAATLTVARTVPDLDFLCVNDNRVWGCRGDEIRCSALGDPFNWNVFDGLSTDSWSWESGTAGDFTGCVSFLGYPVFFKEEAIFKVYGSRPANYEALRSAATGVLSGASGSLAVAGDTLFYLSRAGFMAYSGGMPAPVGEALGRRYVSAVGGSDGQRYYVSAELPGAGPRPTELLVYDTRTRLWHREDDLSVSATAWLAGLYALTGSALVLLGDPPAAPSGAAAETGMSASVTFADWDMGSFDGKYPVRLWLRAEAAAGVTLTVTVRYDGGTRESAFSWQPGAKKTALFPVPIRRCDRFSVKLAADGAFRLYAIGAELGREARSRRG